MWVYNFAMTQSGSTKGSLLKIHILHLEDLSAKKYSYALIYFVLYAESLVNLPRLQWRKKLIKTRKKPPFFDIF